MDIERPHRTTSTPTTTSELFICFTSRLSNSSSMRLSSKSILSPGRAAGGDAKSHSLSSSLSRRLRHNGSLRGAQSPALFSKKNRGSSGFDNNNNNPEPSSPKVTCIGQVRVKTKKQGKKMKMRACRSKRLSGGDASFRRIDSAPDGLTLTHQNSQGVQNNPSQQDCNLPHRNQKWVHLPLTICEALRAFGAEFSCLLPCKSSCFSSCNSHGERDNKEEKRDGSHSSSSCGAVFRWLVALQEGEGEGRERDIELVVGDEERDRRERMVMERECSRRRSIFDDMEFKDEMFDVKSEHNDREEDEEARVSICIPPKNALLLMRCRSDPAKMSALSQKIWEAPPVVRDYEDDVDNEEEEEEKEDEEEGDLKDAFVSKVEEKTEEFVEEECKEIDEMCEDLTVLEQSVEVHEMGTEEPTVSAPEEQKQEEEETEEEQGNETRAETEEQEGFRIIEEDQSMDEEGQSNGCLSEAVSMVESLENDENEGELMRNTEEFEEIEGERERAESGDFSCSSGLTEESTAESLENQQQVDKDPEEVQQQTLKSMVEEEQQLEEESMEERENEQIQTQQEEETEKENNPKWEEKDEENNKPVLPDCLLLMMCEPKLSMEVSKETWVCSTDFIRWLPERHPNKKPNKTDGADEPKKKKKTAPVQPVAPPVQAAVQPGRSSISFPAGGGPVANLIEHKLVKAGVGYEPFVLTRCKSAPMRSTAKNAPPELPCSLWRRENGRKMEPQRPSVGTAGVGF